MGSVWDGIESDQYDRTYGDARLVQRIAGYFRPHWRVVLAVALIMSADSAVSAAIPLLISRGIDRVAAASSAASLWLLAAAVVAFSSLSWVFNYLRQRMAARSIGDAVLQLREDAFAAVAGHDMSFYDEQPAGKIVSRVTSDTQDFTDIAALVINALSQFLLVAILLVLLFATNAFLAGLVVALVPFIVVAALSFRRIARRTTQNARRIMARINALIEESIGGIVIAKSFRREAAVYADFGKLNRQAYRVNLLRGWVLQTILPLMEGATGVGTALLIYYGGSSALRGRISPGQWYFFIQTVGYFWYPLTSLASFWSQLQDGLSAAERVFSLIDAEPKVVQTACEPVGRLEGRIEFRNLGFSYTGREVVFKGFSLTVQPGETVAIVGHTGAGKSSLARLIGRYYEFQDGQILVDGRDIRTLDLAQYRRRIGFVPQEPFLFSGSLCDNIRYTRPEAADAEVAAATKSIARGEWLDDLPNGLQTDVGERGAHISMGQRQLAALARVMLADPSILILDEATSSVDPFTEALIQEGLDVVMRGRTSIVIAHRLSTVRNSNRIIVLRNGEIIEEGDHDSLLAAGGHYAELYNTYFRHQSLEYIEQARSLAEERA
jgi:ATP-binding cassette subfamily B protein